MSSTVTQQTATTGQERPIMQALRWIRTDEGSEFLVERPFPQDRIRYLDPILLLDATASLEAGRPFNAGYVPHAHAGFFSVTYVLSGPAWDGYDSTADGYVQELGSVSWFVAGKGGVHVERPQSPWREDGGEGISIQLWVDLPNELKETTEPARQYVAPHEVPEWTSDAGDVKIRVLTGELFGLRSPANLSPTPLHYYHVILQPGAQIEIPTARGLNAIARPIAGEQTLTVGDRALPPEHFVIMGPGDHISLSAAADADGPTHALVVAAQPHDQEIAYFGPFSAVSMKRIGEHFANAAAGKYGTIDAP